ncbi:hypothetical protein OROHE_017190 [Orobanche hederae]
MRHLSKDDLKLLERRLLGQFEAFKVELRCIHESQVLTNNQKLESCKARTRAYAVADAVKNVAQVSVELYNLRS